MGTMVEQSRAATRGGGEAGVGASAAAVASPSRTARKRAVSGPKPPSSEPNVVDNAFHKRNISHVESARGAQDSMPRNDAATRKRQPPVAAMENSKQQHQPTQKAKQQRLSVREPTTDRVTAKFRSTIEDDIYGDVLRFNRELLEVYRQLAHTHADLLYPLAEYTTADSETLKHLTDEQIVRLSDHGVPLVRLRIRQLMDVDVDTKPDPSPAPNDEALNKRLRNLSLTALLLYQRMAKGHPVLTAAICDATREQTKWVAQLSTSDIVMLADHMLPTLRVNAVHLQQFHNDTNVGDNPLHAIANMLNGGH